MEPIYLAPKWFLGYDVALEITFGLVALIIALFAFKLYKTTKQKQIQIFGAGFTLIALAYFTQAIFNYLIISKLNNTIYETLNIPTVALFDAIGIYTHILFMTLGLATLTYMTFKADRIRILWLIIAMPLLGIFLSTNKQLSFYLFSTIYLIFLSRHFFINYLKKKQRNTLIIAISFLFMLISKIHFALSINYQTFYAIGHILELIAYLLILFNLYLVQKNE